MSERPRIDDLWDYDHPEATEQRFREILAQPGVQEEPGYYAELLTQLARTQSLQRKFKAAHSLLDEAHALLEQAGPRARVRWGLERGRTCNSAGEKEQAQALFLEAWNLAREINEEGLAVDAAHMVAIATGGAAGLTWNLKALDMAEASKDPDARRWRASLQNNIGWSYHAEGEFEDALQMFEQALETRREQGHPEDILVARWCIARCLRSLGRFEEALGAQQLLLQAYAELGQPSGYTHEEIGENLLALGREREAQSYFAQAYAVLSQDLWLADNESARLARLEQLGSESSSSSPSQR